MHAEISPRIALAILAVALVIVGAIAWRVFGASGGQQTAAAAGLGKPMHPGEIPGQRPPVGQTGGAANTGR